MDYTHLIKRLELPVGFRPPAVLGFEGLSARALSPADLKADVKGINESLDLIRNTRGGSWPMGPISEEFNYVDLVWHECEFRELYSFAYAVYDSSERYVGCCYFYPMGRRTPLSSALMKHDVDISWWVTPSAYRDGHYERLYRALQKWSAAEFPFKSPYYSNLEIPKPSSSA
jgi:hypothetical protein